MFSIRRLTPIAASTTHDHPFHEFVLVLAGDYQVHIDGTLITVPVGGSILFPAQMVHRPVLNPGLSEYVIQWDDDAFGPDTVRPWGYPRSAHDDAGDLRRAVENLLTWHWDPAIPATDLAALLRVILRLHAGVQDRRMAGKPLERAQFLLEQHLEENFGLNAIAANVGMSPAALGRHFKASFGMSPMAYRRQKRLDRAMALIQEGALSLEDIAHRVGYATAAHLSNLLQRERQMRPRDLRRRHKET